MIKNAKMTRLVEYPADMDPRLREIISGCMEKDPAKRIDDLEWYKLRLRPLGVDMDLLQKDRYSYLLSM